MPKALRLPVLAVTAALASAACASSRAPVYIQNANVFVETPAGEPLAGTAILHDGQILVRTDADGRAKLQMAGRDGDVFRLHVGCPEGYEPVGSTEIEVLVRRTDSAVTPLFESRCARTVERVKVTIRAISGPDLPILYLGKPVGRTDGAGEATVSLDVRAGSDVDLTLDTSEAKKLHPASPTLSFRATGVDVVLEQAFTVEKPKARPSAPAPRGPIRIGG